MALSDSMFLFEIAVDDFKQLRKRQELNVKCQFGEVFQLPLRNPNAAEKCTHKKKQRKKYKVRDSKSKTEKLPPENRAIVGQTILIASNIISLMNDMKTYPLQMILYKKNDSDESVGSVQIPWGESYFSYLSGLCHKQCVQPVIEQGKYKILHNVTLKAIANIKIKIKFRSLSDKIISNIRPTNKNLQLVNLDVVDSTPANKLREPETTKHNTGTIKTIYAGNKVKPQRSYSAKRASRTKHVTDIENQLNNVNKDSKEYKKFDKENHNPVNFVKSESYVSTTETSKKRTLMKSKSMTSLDCNHFNALSYIFGNSNGPYGNQVYYVGYFTVHNDISKEPSKSIKEDASKSTIDSVQTKNNFKFKLCESDCPSKNTNVLCSPSHCSLDLPKDLAPFISVKKCEQHDCYVKKQREPPSLPDESIRVDVSNRKCCDFTEKVEEIVGDIKAKMKVGNDPCYCTCECTFGFVKKTTYCNVCGGYETVGDEIIQKPGQGLAFPCPIFHKLVDKNKLKSYSSGSDTKKKQDDSQRSMKLSTIKRPGDKNEESEKDNKKGKKKKKDDRFKFNYGYQAPQIGHSQCVMPCTGTLGAVPKHMGWLWTAEDIPGLKFRPMWRPGATNKHVVRLLRMARNPGEVIAKKRRKDAKKKPLKRPLLVVHKKDGEYTVTMETMRSYTKPRAVNQQPYEDKPLITYTIGRSEEENRERRKKKERAHRRLERAQRDFIQSAFKDVCKEICIKTYQQALGILPDTEDPECTCYPAEPGPDRTNVDVSCSCSEASSSLGSDTDSDEWVVEFTPPNALFDPTYKGKKVFKSDTGTQYNYLDYRVKLMDRFGNPVVRFFTGPDGKQECSDLGGFWGPNHQWLEINVDGHIAPDNRWAPSHFIGPNGEHVDAETGKFQIANGKWLVVGIDGYVDGHGKWKFYPRPRIPPQKPSKTIKKKGTKASKPVPVPSEATWSCFGDASPKQLSKMGIVGHGVDRKLLLSTLKDMLARGEDVRIPQPSKVPKRPESKKGRKVRIPQTQINKLWTECKHPTPSDKGIVSVDEYGRKTYFKTRDHRNRRPNQRIANLNKQGVSVSSFHIPCFHSFINSDVMKQQQRDRLLALATGRSVATQV